MNVSGYHSVDVINGPGTRVSLFVSGCVHRCPGCYNAGTWSPKAGQPFDGTLKATLMADLADQRIHKQGLSVSGGDPLYPGNLADLFDLLSEVRQTFADKDIWCWTGYTLETLTMEQRRLLPLIDVLVDGPFIQEQKSPELPWQGSRNQRVHYLR